MEAEKRDEMRDYAWKYFSMHADQRLKAFNFYLILVTVMLGGMFAYVKDAKHPWFISPVGFLLAAVSFIFWKLDGRTKELIQHAENALKKIEQDACSDAVPDEMSLFNQEESKTASLCKSRKFSWNPLSWWNAHYTYSACFQIVFLLLALSGLVVGAGVLLIPPAPEVPPPVPLQQFFIGAQPFSPQK